MATLAERQRLAAMQSILVGVAIAILPLGTPQVLSAVPVLAKAVKGFTPLLGPVLPGWRFETHLNAPQNASRNTPDQQTIAISPQGKTFCIVIKSERGRIGSDGRTVYRLVDQTKNPFPTDFIDQTRQRAARVQQRLQISHVVPVLAFSDAIVAIEQNPVLGVYVLQVDGLRRSLLQLH